MTRTLLGLFVVAAFLAMSALTTTAEDKAAKNGDAPKKEKRSSIEWSEITSARGELKKPEKRDRDKLPKVQFSNDAAAFRVKWTTKPVEGKRNANMSMTLFKKMERRGEAEFKRAVTIGNARGESEGVKVLTVGKGDYYIELNGDAIEYEITVEAAEKKTAE